MNAIAETGNVSVMIELKNQARLLGSLNAKANASRRSSQDGQPRQHLSPRALRPVSQS